MNRNEKTQNRQESSADIIAEIRTARAEARVKVNAYRDITAKKYDYWRAIESVLTYDQALGMFARGTEHYIPDMAATALADFEYARDDDSFATEMDLAFADGRQDALTSVADWMDNKENSR